MSRHSELLMLTAPPRRSPEQALECSWAGPWLIFPSSWRRQFLANGLRLSAQGRHGIWERFPTATNAYAQGFILCEFFLSQVISCEYLFKLFRIANLQSEPSKRVRNVT